MEEEIIKQLNDDLDLILEILNYDNKKKMKKIKTMKLILKNFFYKN